MLKIVIEVINLGSKIPFLKGPAICEGIFHVSELLLAAIFIQAG